MDFLKRWKTNVVIFNGDLRAVKYQLDDFIKNRKIKIISVSISKNHTGYGADKDMVMAVVYKYK